VSQIMRTLERIRHGFNPRLRLDGIVLTMFDRATTCPSGGERRAAPTSRRRSMTR
jgi:hypothetical protein